MRAIYQTGLFLRHWILVAALFAGTSPRLIGDDEAAVVDENEPFVSPLKQSDRTSPRDTYATFIRQSVAAFQYSSEGQIEDAESAFLEAVACLNFPESSNVFIEDQRTESTLLLYEILTRLPEVDLESIPGSEDEDLWIVPHSSLVIERVEEGENEGEFMFNPDTVARLERDYEEIKSFPYLHEGAGDFYEQYLRTPGHFACPGWLAWTQKLPDWAFHLIWGQTIWQWVALLLLVAAIWFAAWLWRRFQRRRQADSSTKSSGLLSAIWVPLVIVLLSLAIEWVFDEQINFTGKPLVILKILMEASLFLGLVWLLWATMNFLLREKEESNTRSHAEVLVHLFLRVLGVIISVVILGYGASRMGVPITGVIAGLGVGGLAFSLAAQPTLQNFLGGIALLIDRPFEVGDVCEIDGHKGEIEYLGIRSTRMRALNRSLVTFTNDNLSSNRIVNISRMDKMLFEGQFFCRPDCSADELMTVVNDIRSVLEEDDEIEDGAFVFIDTPTTGAVAIQVEAYVSRSGRAALYDASKRVQSEITKLESLRKIRILNVELE